MTAPAGSDSSSLHRRSLGAWRVRAVVVGLGSFATITVARGVLIADSSGLDPAYAGMHHADQVVPWLFVASAVAWGLSWLPGLPITWRRRLVQVAVALPLLAVAMWLVWTSVGRGTDPAAR